MLSWLPLQAPGNVEFADYGSKVSREDDTGFNDLTTCLHGLLCQHTTALAFSRLPMSAKDSRSYQRAS